jgi:B-cell receptor-associated protein 31
VSIASKLNLPLRMIFRMLGMCFECNIVSLLTTSSRSVLGHERTEVQARKFYSQRNMYLCGFTLFLSLILNRTYMMVSNIFKPGVVRLALMTCQILETLRLETKLKQYQGDAKASGKNADKLDQAGGANEIGNLKRLLKNKDQDLETLKKQSEGLTREYRELSDKYAATQAQDSTPKKDK